MVYKATGRLQRLVGLTLVLALAITSVNAGITVTGTDGITATGTDGISYVSTSGITATGTDGLLAFNVNGITATGTDGITATGTDGVLYTGANTVIARGVDTMTMASADGITVTGTDGITATGTDGSSYQADSLLIRQANGITATGTDGITATGTDGITATGTDALSIARANGITVTGTDGITVNGASGITATGTDGQIFYITPNSIHITGADGITATGTDGITLNGIDGITATGTDGITATGTDGITATGTDIEQRTGLRSLDPELALKLDRITDDSNVDAVIVYYQQPTDADIANLQGLGIMGGTRYQALPMIAVTATRRQIISVSHLAAVRSIYGNRTLQSTLDPYLALNGAGRVPRDGDLTRSNTGLPVTGRNVTVAVLDTGLDGTHSDLAGRVVQNVKLADTQSVSVGFTSPVNVENVPNTDQVYGHGTFVAGLIAGNGARSGGAYDGVAPGAKLVGLSAGDLNLFYVLAGFDYLLQRGVGLNVRVINCSFSASTVFDTNDPVNVATKMLVGRGINVVFSAGNAGAGVHSLNPYAAAPWVVSVGATDERGRLANFSSRGDFGNSMFHPTLVAPGVNVVSLRSSGANIIGVSGVISADTQRLTASTLPHYTTASGTSFSAPQVAGTIALMLEANPRLTPADVRDILQRTATPLAPYYQYEVGAGMLNAHAAVLEAAFPQRRIGMWRATLDRGQVRFINDPLQQFGGLAQPSGYDAGITIPDNALLASVQIAWGPLLTTNDLGLSVFDQSGVRRAESNTINLPGLTGRRERVAVKQPSSGAWRVHVANTLGLIGTPQQFSGVLEVTRAQYAPLLDIDNLSEASREDVYQNLRSYVMWPLGKRFRPGYGVTRANLAAALVLGARVPQYLPSQSSYTDVRDIATMNFVESVQAAPNGALFIDASAGGRFRPDDAVDRLTAAIVLVRAAGLQAEAEAAAGTPLLFADTVAIPTNVRGFVSVALARGFLAADGGAFRPQSTLTRVELAHALAAIANLATQ
ncbi:MAG: S8 family serine peptidase [Pyrinomonadaceae bacterium]